MRINGRLFLAVANNRLSELLPNEQQERLQGAKSVEIGICCEGRRAVEGAYQPVAELCSVKQVEEGIDDAVQVHVSGLEAASQLLAAVEYAISWPCTGNRLSCSICTYMYVLESRYPGRGGNGCRSRR